MRADLASAVPDKAVDPVAAVLAAWELQVSDREHRALLRRARDGVAVPNAPQDPLAAEPRVVGTAVQLWKAADRSAGPRQVAAARQASAVLVLPGDEVAAQWALQAAHLVRRNVVARPGSLPEAALSDAAASPQAARASAVAAVRKEPGQALEQPKESVARWEEPVATACRARQSAYWEALSAVAPPADESEPHVPASADATAARAAGRRYALLLWEPSWARLTPEVQSRRAVQNPLRRRCALALSADLLAALLAKASVPAPLLLPAWRELRLSPLPRSFSVPAALPSSQASEQQTCRRRNTAAVSRRCRRQSSWNGSAAR